MSAAVFLSILFSVVAPSEPQSLWFLERSQRQPAEGALLEALRIYTRDLDVPITLRRIPGSVKSANEQNIFARGHCRSNALLVLWFEAEGTALHVWHCRRGQESTLPFPFSEELSISVQTLALKVRGLLAESIVTKSLGDSRPSTNASGESSMIVPPRIVAGTASDTPPRSNPDQRSLRTNLPRSARGVEAGVAYFAGTMSTRAGFHQGPAFRLGLVSLTWPLALEFEGFFLGRVTSQDNGNRVVTRALPFTLGLSFRSAPSRWSFAAGPRVGIHYLNTEGHSEDGRSGAVQSVSLILGLGEQLRYAVGQNWSLMGTVGQWMLFPRQRFTLDGRDHLQIGLFQWNLCLGVLYQL